MVCLSGAGNIDAPVVPAAWFIQIIEGLGGFSGLDGLSK